MNGSEEKNRIPVQMNRGDPAESQLGLLRGKGMYLEHLRRVLGHLKRALRKEQPLTVEEFNQLLQLSEAIIDYGQMIKEHFRYPVPEVIVEIPELVHRFGETPQTIKDALLLLRNSGRAVPVDLDGGWKLQLAGILPSGQEGSHSATRDLPYVGRKTNEIHFGPKDLQQH
jgi:hypothetical protein